MLWIEYLELKCEYALFGVVFLGLLCDGGVCVSYYFWCFLDRSNVAESTGLQWAAVVCCHQNHMIF